MNRLDDYCVMAFVQGGVLVVACVGTILVMLSQARRLRKQGAEYRHHDPPGAIILCVTAAATVTFHLGELHFGGSDFDTHCPAAVGVTVAWVATQVGFVVFTRQERPQPRSRDRNVPNHGQALAEADKRKLLYQRLYVVITITSIMLNFVWTFATLLQEGRSAVLEHTDQGSGSGGDDTPLGNCGYDDAKAGFEFEGWHTLKECTLLWQAVAAVSCAFHHHALCTGASAGILWIALEYHIGVVEVMLERLLVPRIRRDLSSLRNRAALASSRRLLG